MEIPGYRKSSTPDEAGLVAGKFAEAVRDSDMLTAWNILSLESKGIRQGVWATHNNIDLQIVYKAAHDPYHPLFESMMYDLRNTILNMWPLEDLTDLGVAPSKYIDDQHAFAFLPFGIVRDQHRAPHGSFVPGLIIPMLLESGTWKVDLPSWRYYSRKLLDPTTS